MRWRTLALLVAAVLAGHWFALYMPTRAWSIVTTSNAAMITRSIEAPPQPIAPEAMPTPPAAPAPVKPTPAPPLPAVPPPVEQPLAQLAPPAPLETPTPAPLVVSDTPTFAQPMTTSTLIASDAPAQNNGAPDAKANALDGDPQFPPSGKFAYSVDILRGGQTQTASGTLNWATDGRTYALQLDVSYLLIPVLRQTSAGSMTSDGLLPDRFLEKRGTRSETATHFKRTGFGLITFSNNQPDAVLLRGAQDRLSVLMQLTGMAAGSPVRFTPGSAATIQTAGVQEAEVWQFNVEAEEIIQVPAGQAQTLRVVRQARKEFDTRIEVWLAPAVGYLPIRFRQTEQNGNVYDLQLSSPKLP